MWIVAVPGNKRGHIDVIILPLVEEKFPELQKNIDI